MHKYHTSKNGINLPNPKLTLILLCIGYFIDFYDLTVMSVAYPELIREQFNITDTTKIQQTYLLISNFQTVGILIGALLFGMLGDKIGRAAAIKYSILLYSVATILAVFTNSLPLFIFLRVIAYIGLAAEFSTSTVLILELLPPRLASWGVGLLYTFGVLGGITATAVGFFSWKIMFILGGFAGLVLYIARSKINESIIYQQIQKATPKKGLGNIYTILTNKTYLLGILRYTIIIMPFYSAISMMYIFPNHIIDKLDLSTATKILLMGFFIGNIISAIISAIANNYFKDYRKYLQFLLIIYIIIMFSFTSFSEQYLLVGAIILGLIGGGYPVTWGQQLAKEFPTELRNTASNLLFGLGRVSGICFNLMISSWLVSGQFLVNSKITVAICFCAALIAVYYSRNNYTQNLATSEKV